MKVILLSCGLGSLSQEASSRNEEMSVLFSVNLSLELKSEGVSALSGALGKNGTDEGESEKLEQSQGIISVSFFLSL